jgi:aspartate beta-hydroxylase
MKSRNPDTMQCLATQLQLLLDEGRLVAKLERVTTHLWNRQRSHTHTGGIADETTVNWRVLPLQSLGSDRTCTDPGGPGSIDFADTIWRSKIPYVSSILDLIPAPLNAVRLMALGPGTISHSHADAKYRLDWGFVRLHIPVVTHPGAILLLDGVEHCWRPATLWYGDFSRPHLARNMSSLTRIHLVIDALLIPSLVTLFPTSWHHQLLHGDVLLDRQPPTLAACSHALPETSTLPRNFTGFNNNYDLDDLMGGPCSGCYSLTMGTML